MFHLVLGKPFFAICGTLIDVQKGDLIAYVQDDRVKFNIFKTMKFPNDHDEYFYIDMLDTLLYLMHLRWFSRGFHGNIINFIL